VNPEVYRTEDSRDTLLAFYDEVVGTWSFPHESAMVRTRHGETHLITSGDRSRPAVVLLHGAAANVLGWGAAIPAYRRDFFVIAPDIPGEAGRSAPKRPSWDGDEYIDWLDDVLAALRVQRTALLGLSLGGWIAARYAAARPQKACRLVLLAPAGIAPMRTAALLKTVLFSMQRRKGAARMKRMVFGRGEILPEVSRFFDLLQQHYVPRFGSPPVLSDEQLKAIACPVLMMTGGEDAFFNALKAGARLRRVLPRSEIHIEDGGEHGITEYGGRIARFLAAS